MHINGLAVRITIEKNETVIDRYANHKSEWRPYFSCWSTALASGQLSDEDEMAGHTVEEDRMDFTVRWSSETARVSSKGYRIRLEDRIYDIDHVDDMGFRKNSLKFHCRLVERS